MFFNLPTRWFDHF